MPSVTYATTKYIAERLKLDASGVRRRLVAAANEGRIVRDAVGKWPVSEAMALLNAEIENDKVAGHNSIGRGNVESPEITSLSRARATAEQARAQKLLFDLEIKRGNYVPLDQVKEAGQDLCARVRTAFASIGHRVAGRVLGETDPLGVAEIINAEAISILAELSDAGRFVDSLLETRDDDAA